MRDYNSIHNCNDHMACNLLNPSLEDLMSYEDLTRRLAEHNSGRDKFTTRKHGQWILVYAEAL